MLSDRQQQIINEAIILIDKKGIQGLTIKNLSKAIGISEPGIYRHFESKFHILTEILDEFKDNINEFNKELMKSNLNSLKKIGKIYQTHFNFFVKNPAIISVIFAEEIFNNDKILYKKINEILKANEELISQIIEEGQNTGEIKNEVDKKQIALIIMGSLRLLVKKWKQNSYSFDLKLEGNKLLETIKILIIK